MSVVSHCDANTYFDTTVIHIFATLTTPGICVDISCGSTKANIVMAVFLRLIMDEKNLSLLCGYYLFINACDFVYAF